MIKRFWWLILLAIVHVPSLTALVCLSKTRKWFKRFGDCFLLAIVHKSSHTVLVCLIKTLKWFKRFSDRILLVIVHVPSHTVLVWFLNKTLKWFKRFSDCILLTKILSHIAILCLNSNCTTITVETNRKYIFLLLHGVFITKLYRHI